MELINTHLCTCGCGELVSKTWKLGHYKTAQTKTVSENFLKHITIDTISDCWLWTGCKNKKGYGVFCIKKEKRVTLAHRVSYELFVGKIPEGLEIDHLCRNRLCQNPKHLEAVTHIVNISRGDSSKTASKINGVKTQCIRGHLFNLENTRIDTLGHRHCKTCDNKHLHTKENVVGFTVKELPFRKDSL
ncbi:MAG: HNH endonuclease signature motif containing protein [bacterium]|nr:HNH endonuclease signature motif containing protein [bacterium]